MRALITEDNPVSRRVLARAVANLGMEVVTTDDGDEAWGLLSGADAPELAILGGTMSGPGTADLCRRVRSLNRRTYTYLIVLAGAGGTQDVLAAFQAGADDSVTKDIDPREFEARLRAAKRMIAVGVDLVHQATRDGLTGLWNASTIRELLESEVARARRTVRTIAVIMVDLDHFKQVNDQYGHKAGDMVLQEVCARMRGVLRRYDTVGRVGGEEFLIVLPEPEASGAEAVAERIRQAICRTPLHVDAAAISFTASMGVAVATHSDDMDVDRLLSRADAALYEAKRAGRNRTCGAQATQS